MKEEDIKVRYPHKKRRYSSYVDEISPAVEDLLKHNFHADAPNRVWLTDITEFAAANAKVYLSPIVDCFDGRLLHIIHQDILISLVEAVISQRNTPEKLTKHIQLHLDHWECMRTKSE